jgi:aspartyl-tRNA(Asn)/glutamyl-tRNA(Gln) amidotransferase subunit C
MAGVTPEETEALAHLARLSLGENEREVFAGQLHRILAYIDTLARVDVEGVEEYEGEPGRAVGLREDVGGPMLERERILADVPEARDGQVAVPKFKED